MRGALERRKVGVVATSLPGRDRSLIEVSLRRLVFASALSGCGGNTADAVFEGVEDSDSGSAMGDSRVRDSVAPQGDDSCGPATYDAAPQPGLAPVPDASPPLDGALPDASPPPDGPPPEFQIPSGVGLSTQVLACWLWKHALWGTGPPFFDSPSDDDGVRLYGARFGLTRENWARLWITMDRCAHRVTESNEDGHDWRVEGLAETADVVERLSGIPMFAEPFDAPGGVFNAYNPVFIQWAVENVIPSPDDRIEGLGLSLIYDRVFSAFARRMAETYVYLQERALFESEVDALWDWLVAVDDPYTRFAESPECEGVFSETWTVLPRVWCYLVWRFDLVPPPAGETAWVEPEAASTALELVAMWLRRGLDGTHDEVWSGVARVMRLYDAEWYAELRRTYPNARVTW